MTKNKTEVTAEEDKHDLHITRDFDLPVELIFKAHAEAEMLEQWMGSKVLKLEGKKHGSYQLEKKDENGNVVFRANGVFHQFIANQKIIRTFEMENAPFGVQFEILQFEKLSDSSCKLNIHSIYESVALRDQHLTMPFSQGLNMAHNRLEEIVINQK